MTRAEGTAMTPAGYPVRVARVVIKVERAHRALCRAAIVSGELSADYVIACREYFDAVQRQRES